MALGFGKGKLRYVVTGGSGQWHFSPAYENNPHDGLPQDAWTGFLQNRTGMVSTRKNVKPFPVKEQEKVLLAGACLTCHKGSSKVMKESLNDFEKVLQHRSPKCVLPVWPEKRK